VAQSTEKEAPSSSMSGKKRAPMTVKEASKHLNVPMAKVREFCDRKLIRCSKAMPGKWLLDRDDVETFVERTS
jgi:excisionase family DNA binding protein